MGFFKDTKAAASAREAEQAFESGRVFFTPRLNLPMTHHAASGDIPDWAVIVEAIEASGWRLEHWSVGMDAKGRPEAYPLFRRA